MNRLFLSAVLDRTTTVDEVRAALYALVQGRPLQIETEQAASLNERVAASWPAATPTAEPSSA